MKRDSPKRVYEAVTTTMVPLVVSGLKLWPAVHLVTVSCYIYTRLLCCNSNHLLSTALVIQQWLLLLLLSATCQHTCSLTVSAVYT
jgi:hypothetical protein